MKKFKDEDFLPLFKFLGKENEVFSSAGGLWGRIYSFANASPVNHFLHDWDWLHYLWLIIEEKTTYKLYILPTETILMSDNYSDRIFTSTCERREYAVVDVCIQFCEWFNTQENNQKQR
jgi:hypothetical protein